MSLVGRIGTDSGAVWACRGLRKSDGCVSKEEEERLKGSED